jgi:multidrug efflux pump subunit AcrA (membrane-fusion protein)
MDEDLRELSYPTIPQLRELVHEHGQQIHSLDCVSSPWSTRALGYIFALFLVGFVVALIYVPWVQTSFGTGTVIAYSPNERQQNIEAPIEGRIAQWHVLEGMKVKAGDPIVSITDIDPQIMERLNLERDAAKSRLSAANTGLETSKKNLERQKILADKGLTSQRGYELAQLEIARFNQEVATATQELARIEVRISRQSSQTVTAPRDGVMQRIVAPEGSAFVKAGTPLAVIVPDTDDRAVQLYIDGNDLPLVQVGRHARLQFEGWPAVQFAGWPAVAKGTFGGTVAVIDPSDDGTGHFRIIIFPDDPKGWPEGFFLRQGTRVNGWVLLDTVKLGYEIWRKFNGFPKSMREMPKDNKKQNLLGDRPKKEQGKKDAVGSFLKSVK